MWDIQLDHLKSFENSADGNYDYTKSELWVIQECDDKPHIELLQKKKLLIL